MASIGNDSNGRKRILFISPDGKRKTIRLGRADLKQATAAKLKIEALVSAAITGGPPDDETSRWLAGLGDKLYARLAAVGLVMPRDNDATGFTLDTLIDTYFKHLDVKPVTRLGYQSTRTALLSYFGANRPVNGIGPLEAEQWRAALKDRGMAEATIAKRVRVAKGIFQRGIDWGMLDKNPFAKVRGGSQVNRERLFFVTRDMADRVTAACPDAEWRLIFALSRYGGLRCPSETLSLKWADVNWERGSIRVTCSKTERHAGRAERFCPIFPELRGPLMEVFERTEPGSEFVITRYRNSAVNLRTRLTRIIRKAGLKQWPRLFHNLRSTRQTELTNRFPAHVVAGWIGNSERVAEQHYLQITDEHFAQALADGGGGEKAAQNPAQQTAEITCNDRKATGGDARKSPDLRDIAKSCTPLHRGGMASVGLEPTRLWGTGF